MDRLKMWDGALGLALALGMVLVCVSCNPATVAFRQGRKAEEQKDYDSAVIHFEQALKEQPNNTHFMIWAKDARYKASYAHTDRGRRLLAQHQPDAAAGEFQKAISIDPSNQAASQELHRILLKQSAAQQRREQTIRQAMERRDQSQSSGVVKLKELSTEAIAHLHISSDSRNVFETLGKLAGINVVFYYSFQPKPISLDLTHVTILDALKAAADEANVFWKPITSNTILIVPNTLTNRRELEPKELKTIYLQNPLPAADRTAILTAVKTVAGIQQAAFENPETNSITVYDTPEKVAEAVELIHNLDRGKAEVLIDVTVLEADKDRLRDLGLAPVPLSNTGTMAAVGFAPPGTGGTTTGGTTIPPNLTLNKLGKVSTSDFSIELPGVIANALLNDSRTHILQNPQVRVTAGEKAILHIGSRVPFATGTFGVPSAGTGGSGSEFGLLANTQFQYQDVGVSLTITPYVAADGDIVLTNKIDISAVGTPSNIGGLEQPTFTERSIEHTIRLKEGEVSLLGGLIQSQTTNAVSGIPGLADIPLLRYLFSTTTAETVDQEVMIMLTPHVIRLPDILNSSGQSQADAALPTVPPPHPAAAPPQGVPQ